MLFPSFASLIIILFLDAQQVICGGTKSSDIIVIANDMDADANHGRSCERRVKKVPFFFPVPSPKHHHFHE